MKTYYVYWTPQKHLYAKVEAETAEDAYKAVVGELDDCSKAHIIYEDVEDESETLYEVYEDDEEHKTSTLKATFCND